MNIFASLASEETIAELFRLLAQPTRLQILAAIGEGEACVCHLEALLGLRQSYISQQLMILRDSGVVTAHRDGRNIYYRLEKPSMLDLLRHAATLLDASEWIENLNRPEPVAHCPCPHCSEQVELQQDEETP